MPDHHQTAWECKVKVKFNPSVTGSITGTLTIDSGDADADADGEVAVSLTEGVGNFVFVSHRMSPWEGGGRYGGKQGRWDWG